LSAQPKKRLAAGWTEDKVRALSTDVILERLAGFGIVTSANAFVEQARAEHAASAMLTVGVNGSLTQRAASMMISSA
jgi:hypothetical protein